MTRRRRLLVLLGLAAAGGLLALAGALPEGQLTVGEAVATGGHRHGDTVTIKAGVQEGSLVRDDGVTRFVLTDGVSELPVLWTRPLPDHEGTLEGRNVLVTGTLEPRDGQVVLVGREMQVGCASKYERAT